MAANLLLKNLSLPLIVSLNSQLPPQTAQHNGNSKRLHRHIVKSFLTLLTHAKMSLTH